MIGGATSNHPTVYIDSSVLTSGSGLTQIDTPSGSAANGNGSRPVIGNREDESGSWGGALAEFAIWNALLTDAEFMILAKGYSPLFIRPNSLVEYIPMLRNSISYKQGNSDVIDTAIFPHPRIIMPHRRQIHLTAAAAILTQTLFPAHFAKRSYVALVTQ